MTTRCCIPGCGSAAGTASLCHVPTKRFCTGKKYEWAEKFEKVIRGMRSDTWLSDLYRKDAVRICLKHFTKEDLENKGHHYELKVGAIPSLEMPDKEFLANMKPIAPRSSVGEKERRAVPVIKDGIVLLPKPGYDVDECCVAFGCDKRKKDTRSDSEGSDDEDSEIKRKYPRTFHHFPTEPKLFRQWIMNIRRKDWFPNTASRLCSDHFKEDFIVRNEETSDAKLTKNAVPTRFKALCKAQAAVELKRKKVKRQRHDILADFPDEHLISEYRANRQMIGEISKMLKSKLQRKSKRSNALSVEEQVMVCLKLMASGDCQYNAKDSLNIAQTTMCAVFDAFLDALVGKVQQFIKMPSDLQATMDGFRQIAGVPDVIGAIGVTRIPIITPNGKGGLCSVEKSNRSVDIQAICDDKMLFTDIVTRWPGLMHSALVLKESLIHKRFEKGEFEKGYLLGCSEYPLLKWLMRPYQTVTSLNEKAYNKAHKTTQSIIERAFCILKQRWRILDHGDGHLCYAPLKTCKIIVCCAVLHNMCIVRGVPLITKEALRSAPISTVKDAESTVQEPEAISLRNSIAAALCSEDT